MSKSKVDEFGFEVEGDEEKGVIQENVSSRPRPHNKKAQIRPESDELNTEVQTVKIQDAASAGSEMVVMEQITPTEDNLPSLGGHTVTLNEWAAFQTHALTGSVEEAARAGNVTPWSIWRWRRTDWWRQLHTIFIETHQAKFHDRMAARADEIHDAYFAVMSGNEKYGKTANAIIQGCKIFMQSGADPILKSKPVIEIQKNTQINNLEIGHSRFFNLLSKEELSNYARTGQVPDDVRSRAEALVEKEAEMKMEALVVKSTIPAD